MSILEELESRKPLSYFERSKILFDDAEKFLEMYNYHFIRFGSYIDDLYNLALKITGLFWDVPLANEEAFKNFYDKYCCFCELKVKQFLEFKEIDDEIRK